MSNIFTIGPDIGMSKAEIAGYSVYDYADALARRDGNRLARYRSYTDAVAAKTGQQVEHGGSLLVPGEVAGKFNRDLTAGAATAGGFIVGTQVAGFVQSIGNSSLISKLPLTRLPNLRSNVTIGAETVKGSAGWAAESVVAPDAQSTYGQIALTPKFAVGKMVVSRQLGLQLGPDANAFLMSGLGNKVGEAVNTGILHGIGAAGQPTGLANIAGIDTRAGTSLALADVVAMVKVSEGYEGGTGPAAVAGVNTAEILRKRERAAGNGMLAEGSSLCGMPMIVTRAASANTLTITDWSNVWFADWGAIELQVDPFTYFQAGRVQVLARWQVDVAVDRAGKVAHASAVS